VLGAIEVSIQLIDGRKETGGTRNGWNGTATAFLIAHSIVERIT